MSEAYGEAVEALARVINPDAWKSYDLLTEPDEAEWQWRERIVKHSSAQARKYLDVVAPFIRSQVIQESVNPEGTKFTLVNGWLVREVNSCTCYGGGPYGHEPGCGLEAELNLTDQIEEIRADERRKVLEELVDENPPCKDTKYGCHCHFIDPAEIATRIAESSTPMTDIPDEAEGKVDD